MKRERAEGCVRLEAEALVVRGGSAGGGVKARRWPVGPLVALVAASAGLPAHRASGCPGCLNSGWNGGLTPCLSRVEFSRRVGVSQRTAERWERVGLTDHWADVIACRVGLHPGEVWGGWAQAALTPLDDVFVNGCADALPGWRPAFEWACRSDPQAPAGTVAA